MLPGSTQVVPGGVMTLSETGLAAHQDGLECCWGLAEGAYEIFSIPLVEIFGRWQDIIGSLDCEACPECLHLPQLFTGDLPLLHSLPCHPLALLCLSDSFGTPCCLLLPTYLLHDKLASLEERSLGRGWCSGPEANRSFLAALDP